MKPELFKIFGLPVNGYGLMISIGIIAAILTIDKRSQKRGYNSDKIFNLMIIAIISGVLGGKLLYIITEIKAIIKDPAILLDFSNGFVIYGAIVLGALSVVLYSKKQKWSPLKVLDLLIPSVALAQGFGRIGCFLAGCCYGAATNLRIGVDFKNSPFCPAGVLRHPTQIYSAIFDFILAFILFKYASKERTKGSVMGLYMMIYSVGRFLVEFLRDDPRGIVGFLSTSQFISIFVFIGGILMFILPRRKKNV